MAENYMNAAKKVFFKVVPEYPADASGFTIPCTVLDGTDAIQLQSRWTTVDVQGGTQSLVAYENVQNPTVPIQIKFNQDLCREFSGTVSSYESIIRGFANIQYPVEDSGKIKPPYCKISWDGKTCRGYFTNIRITLSGPYKRGFNYKSECEISANFTISPKSILKNGNVDILHVMT